MSGLQVINPGLYTSVQDLGRKAYQAFGMPVAGSMDDYAHRMANLLLGNDEDAPLLEMTAFGGTYKFESQQIIAITGSDMKPILNGNIPVKLWRTQVVMAGDILTFSTCDTGFRSYLSVAGGFKLPQVMGSYATYTRGKLGGLEGRALEKGDVIPWNRSSLGPMDLLGRFIRVQYLPSYERTVHLRVVLGPQEDTFSYKGIADFFGNTYTVSNEADRMGYRLDGKKIEHVDSADIISDGIIKGAVQVPSHGQPIIMMADCQTTGGYTKLAHVISTDLWKIAQLKAGDKISFKAVRVEEAQEAYKERMATYRAVNEQFDQYRLEGYQEQLALFQD